MGNPTFSQSSEIISARTQYDDTLRDTTSKWYMEWKGEGGL